MMVVNARSYPASMAAFGVLPLRSSSRIRSKIMTFASIDIPTVRMSPAMPGRVKVAWSEASTAKTRRIFHISAKSAKIPAIL